MPQPYCSGGAIWYVGTASQNATGKGSGNSLKTDFPFVPFVPWTVETSEARVDELLYG